MIAKLTTACVVLALGCGSALAQAAKPSDAQIAHVAYTAGQIDIKAAELALRKSKNKEVRAFADDMVRDHKAVNDKALALVKKLNVTPEDNDISKGLVKQANETEASLSKLDGAAFDKAYAGNEVAYHKSVNGAFQQHVYLTAGHHCLRIELRAGIRKGDHLGKG